MIVSEATEVRAAIAAEVAVVAMAERETECSGWSAGAIYCHQPVDGGDPSKGQNRSGPADSFWPLPTHPGAAAAGGAEASSELGDSAPGDAVAAAAAHGHATAGRAAGDAGGDAGPWWAETTAQATTVAAHIGGHGAGQQTKRIE